MNIFAKYRNLANFAVRFREVAQLVSARVWGARGRWFESSLPDEKGVQQSLDSFFCAPGVFRRPLKSIVLLMCKNQRTLGAKSAQNAPNVQ